MGKSIIIKGVDFSKVSVGKVTFQDPNKVLISVLSDNTEYGKVVGGGQYNKGEQIYIEAIPYAGIQFVRWSDGDTNAKRQITVESNVTLTAFFELIPTLWQSTLPKSECFTGENDRKWGVTNPHGSYYKQVLPSLANKTVNAVTIKVINGDFGNSMDISNSQGTTVHVQWVIPSTPSFLTIHLPQPLAIADDGEIRISNISGKVDESCGDKSARSSYTILFSSKPDANKIYVGQASTSFSADMFYSVH